MKITPVPIDKTPGFTGRFAYNCSIVEYEGKTLLFFRYEPDHHYTTEIGMVELDPGFQPIPGTFRPLRITRHSSRIVTLDDPRAIAHNNRLYIVHPQGVVTGNHKWASSVCVTQLGEGGVDVARWRPRYGNNVNCSTDHESNLEVCEKNWSPFSYGDELRFVYTINPLVVISLDLKTGETKEVSQQAPINIPGWRWGDFIGGSTPLKPWRDGTLAGFFHTRTHDNPGHHNAYSYHVGFYAISSQKPHRITHISTKPLLSAGHDKDDPRPSNSLWRPNVVYPCGWIERGGQVLLSAGYQDSSCMIIQLDWSEILQGVKEL